VKIRSIRGARNKVGVAALVVVRTLGAPEALAVIALSIANRERILRAVEDCPDGLAELRSVLLREHEWRMREGLV
jgi:hypothetical protein